MIQAKSLATLLLASTLLCPAWAQDDDETPPPSGKQGAGAAEYDKAVKDLKKVEGPWTLYQRKKDLLLELPEAKLGQLFCLQASFNTGIMADGLQAGFPAGDLFVEAYRFDRHDDNVWLVRPHLSHRWQDNDPLAKSAGRSFPDAVLASFPIEQKNPDKKLLLVNVTNLFNGDVIRLSEAVQATLGGPYMLDRSKSGPEVVKGFPENTVVRMSLYYASQGRGQGNSSIAELLGLAGGDQLEDPRSAPIKVSYNVWFRRDGGYVPRVGDPRVGYFTADYYDLSRFSADDRVQRVIARWNLKKKDPQAKVSEPVKPIVWWIDPSVPKEYRQACASGILGWNKAFEAIGFKDAIQVKFVADDDQDWDHTDGRHNVLRWTMSEDATYAVTLPRIDPISGEILSAGINVDANMLYAAFREKERLVNPSSAAFARSLDVLTRNDARDEALPTDAYLLNGDAALKAKAAKQKLSALGWSTLDCRYAEGLANANAFGWDALLASGKPPVSKEEYAKEFIEATVAHEAGHSFGLRHNFVASAVRTTAQLEDDKVTGARGITSSVMDYTPPNIAAIVKGGRNYYANGIGDYDLWAIQYGYSVFPGKSDTESEKPDLSKIAAQSGKPEYRFMTDEEADTFDPYVVRFDCAKDPLNFSEKLLQASQRILSYAVHQLPKSGESYGKRTQLIVTSLSRRYREGLSMARFVGGISASRNFKGDVGQRATLAPVAPEVQRQAMDLIARYCFSTSVQSLPNDVLQNLSLDVEGTVGTPGSPGWQAPLRSTLGTQANMLYSLLMSAATTQRIAENEVKFGNRKDAYTLKEHFDRMTSAVFSEARAGKSVEPLRRDLQRFAANALMVQAGAPAGAVNEDVRMLASAKLRQLSGMMGSAATAKKTAADAMTRLHFGETKAIIDRFLSRTNVITR
ncbi:MAG: zinc-dependent metalloprotease [Armatimonadetes bacterium]|nr:zinc-dependent metalloprotease [Armatimonadota bacterium]